MATELRVKEFSALPVADDGKTLLYAEGAVKQSSKNLSEMLTDKVNNKLDTTAFSTVSGSFLTAHQVIPSGKWENVSDVVIANSATWETETDWTEDINAASAYAYEQAVAQIPAPFDPSFLSGEIDKKLDKTFSSNFYPMNDNPSGYLTEHQSLEGYLTKLSGDEYYQPKGNYVTDTQLEITSGEIVSQIPSIEGLATETLVQNVSGDITALIPTDYYPDNNPSGFITGVDLTPYQTISGMTAYQPAGDYATTNYVNEEIGKVGSYVTATLVNNEPDVQNPSNKKIYLTKDDTVTGIDLYKEWIYTESSAWECIGDTSMDLSDYVTNNTFETTTDYLSGAIDGVSANAKDVLYVKVIPGPGAGTLDTDYATINAAINNGKIVIVQHFDPNLYYYYSTKYSNGNIYFTTTYTKGTANTLTVNEIYIKNTQETNPTVYADLSKTYDFNDYATITYVNDEIGKISSYVTATLVSGEPDVQNPSTKVIYLTKDDSVSGVDKYKEWIYDSSSSWNCIGDTSISLDDYVMKTQTAVSIGSNNTATAPNTLSQGSNNTNAPQSFTQGTNNTAGENCIAQGTNNNAGQHSLAQGYKNKAGTYSLSQGYENSAGDYCVAVGYSNTANSNSFAQGYKNSATLTGFTQGEENSANCQAFAAGESALAMTKSFAQGHNVTAKYNSFAQGYGTSAETDSFAQGTNTSALDYSFVQGRNNESYSYSFVQGAGNIADTDGFAQGRSNSGFLMSLAQGWGNRAQSGSLAVGDSNTAYTEGVTIGAKNFTNGKSFTQGGLNSALNVAFAQGEVNYAQTRGFAQGTKNSAMMAAVAIGQCNYANNQAVAFGEFNNAGSDSISVGACNSATSKSVAIGAKTSAYENSLAVGGGVTAYSQSFAQGGGNSARNNSFAQGGGNTAEYNSMAQGGGNSAYSGAISVGGGNSAINYSQAFGLHSIITDYGMAIGKYNKTSADAYFVIGNGYVDYTQHPYETVRSDLFVVDKTGNVSAKSGFFYDKNGKVGGGTTYKDGYLISIGNNFKLNFTNLYCSANSAKYNVAIGDRTYAEGSASVAMGKYTSAFGDYSHSEGELTRASGAYSHAEGSYTTANGPYAHTEGYYTSASISAAHAEGEWTTANGQGSHTEGYQTVTTGRYSHAEGYQTTASGQGSHAEGSYTRAIGDYSLSVGENTSAKGYCSFAGGGSTVANYSNQVVIGKYNDNKTNTLFEVGNGTYNTRNNALEVYKDGTVSGGDFVAGGVSLSSLTPVTLTFRTVGE